MADIIYPGESSLTDCPSLLGNGGYQIQAGTAAKLCVPGEVLDGDDIEDFVAKVSDVFCLQDTAEVTVEPGEGSCGYLLTLPNSVLDRPGIYLVQSAVIDNGRPTQIQEFLVSVEPSLWTIGTDYSSAMDQLTIDRVRTQLRDAPGGTIISGYEYTVREIIHSLMRPIEFWNSCPPPAFHIYSPSQFPYTYQWLEGTCANLLKISATWYLRQSKRMNYSGGLTTDDREKHTEYLRLAVDMWTRYEMFVRETRLALIRNSGVTPLGSGLPPVSFGEAYRGF
jgi:hypothetical protein